MIVQFLKPFSLQTDQGLEHFDVDDRADVPQYVARQLQERGLVKMTDALRIGDKVEAQKVCLTNRQGPHYEKPINVKGIILELDEPRGLAKIQSLTCADFWSPLARMQKI